MLFQNLAKTSNVNFKFIYSRLIEPSIVWLQVFHSFLAQKTLYARLELRRASVLSVSFELFIFFSKVHLDCSTTVSRSSEWF